MTGEIRLDQHKYAFDFSNPLPIGITIRRKENPGCYFTDPITIEPVKSGDFVGSIEQGGAVNHMRLSMAPHGNGTHTECSGHIFNNGLTINEVLHETHFICQVVSVTPMKSVNDYYIDSEQIDFSSIPDAVNALAIRTMPNTEEKLSKNYSGTNPPFISTDAMKSIVEHGIDHLIVDLPSVDPEVDEGQLSAHKMFWNNERRMKHCTITELAYIPNNIPDGTYLINLQALRIELDTSPSNPVLYSLKSIS